MIFDQPTKPRLRKWPHVAMWTCRGGGHVGSGVTPKIAYGWWLKSALFLPAAQHAK